MLRGCENPEYFRRLGFDASSGPASVDSDTLVVNHVFERIPQAWRRHDIFTRSFVLHQRKLPPPQALLDQAAYLKAVEAERPESSLAACEGISEERLKGEACFCSQGTSEAQTPCAGCHNAPSESEGCLCL